MNHLQRVSFFTKSSPLRVYEVSANRLLFEINVHIILKCLIKALSKVHGIDGNTPTDFSRQRPNTVCKRILFDGLFTGCLLQVLFRNIINATQCGFIANNSCQTNLLQISFKKVTI